MTRRKYLHLARTDSRKSAIALEFIGFIKQRRMSETVWYWIGYDADDCIAAAKQLEGVTLTKEDFIGPRT